MFRVQIDRNKAWVTQRETLTMYSENYDAVWIELDLSNDWDGLTKIGVFRAGDVQIDVPVTSSNVTIPVNAVLQPNVHLFFGLYGMTTSGGRIAIPTTWADLGIIQPAADPTAADNYGQPVPDLYEQLQAMAAQATTGSYSGTLTFALDADGKIVITRTAGGNTDETKLGPVTAYAAAKAAGYTGTEAQFQQLLIANYITSQTLTELEESVTAAQAAAEAAEDAAESAEDKADDAKDAVEAMETTVAGKQAKYKTATVQLASGASSWADQTATGVTATNLVIWDVAPADYAVAAAAQIHMTAQGNGVVSFASVNATTAAVTINLAIFD